MTIKKEKAKKIGSQHFVRRDTVEAVHLYSLHKVHIKPRS